ncbi:hypothetical protein IKE19_00165 [Candidatus Saccharibacteria bacterium]|nr:hypothetical protein [Candidatus Saccharibacteria bacterium]
MLVTASHLVGTPILSVQASAKIAEISEPIIDPDTLKIVAFKVAGPMVGSAYILDAKSIREYSQYGMVIDSIDDLAEPDDIIKVAKILELNFMLPGLKVETKKGTKLGKVTDYTVTDDNFLTQQIIVKRPFVKSLMDPTLTIPRKEIVEVTDYKVIVKDEEKTIRARAEKEDFIPNFVNPFREPGFAPSQTETPVDKDTE